MALLWLAFALQAGTVAQLSGSQLSGSRLQQQLDAAVAAQVPSFALPKNTGVRFARGEGLLLSRAANMATVGENTTLWFQPGGGLKVLRCANVSISGVIIDYHPLPYVQAEILAMAPAAAAPRSPAAAARRTLPAAALAPCASPPDPHRPVPPCPHGWWQPTGTALCDQGCPLGSQARSAATGRCLCGQSAPNDKCLAGETCVGGQCSDPSSRGNQVAESAFAGQVWRLGVPFKGFVSNAASKSCLNVDDCATDLIFDGCPAAEGKDETTCAGKGNYSIFQFALEFADGNASHQQLRSVYGDNSCVAAVAQAGKCSGCSGDPCTRRVNGSPVPCAGCSASALCASPPPPPTLQRRPCDPRDDSQLWIHTDLGQLRSGTGGAAAGLCLTAGLPAPGPVPPPPPPRVKYTLRLAQRSNLFNFSCAPPNPNSSSPWASNTSVCEHDGINQLFGSDRRAKIGSDFGSCAASQMSPLLCPGGALPSVPSVGSSYHMLNERDAVAEMPAMLDADGASIAKVGDFITYSGRDWYTYTLANSSNVTTFDVTIHSSSGFTIVELDGECGHTYRRVNVVRREGYMIASNGDVFHSSDCARGATIEDSIFEASLDDFYNVHTTVHVAWTPPSLVSKNAADNSEGSTTAVYIIQPRETGTSESVGPEVSEYWYGTASPMSSMRPGDSLSCFTFNTKSAQSVPVANLTLSAFPQPVTNEAELASATALGAKLQANAGSNRWVSLRLWKAMVRSSAAGALPLAVMCDLDRYSNRGLTVRRNLFRDSGHPQCGGRVKSSGALIEGNTFRSNAVLNQEVAYLQSWLEGPTHIRDVLIRNNTYENCTAVHGGPLSAQPASFFSLCGPPYCHNNTQVDNIARPSTAVKHDDHSAPPIAPVTVPPLAPPPHILAVCLFDDPRRIARNPIKAEDKAELTMLNSLAGLLLRRGGAIGLYLEANIDARMVLQDLEKRRSVTVTYATQNSTAWTIARQLTAGTNITSFALYDASTNPQSTNVARMAVSVHHSLMVEASTHAGAVAAGFTMAANVSGLDDAWALKNWVPKWEQLSGGGTKTVALEQSNQAASGDTDRVNDIASAFGALAFGDVGAGDGSSPGPTRDAFLSAMPTQGLVFGWPSYNEVSSIPDVSAHNKLYLLRGIYMSRL